MIIRDVLNVLHVRNHYFVDTRRIASFLPKKISVSGFFQLASSSPQQQRNEARK